LPGRSIHILKGDPAEVARLLEAWNSVNYPSGAIGEDIFAEGRILKRGKEIIYTDVRVTNEAGKLIAQGTVVYRIVEREAEGKGGVG